MAQVGPQYAGTAANNTGTGTVAWANVSNALAANSTYATVTPGADQSNYLWLTGFDFSTIGDADTVDAILVEVLHKASVSNRINDNILRLIVAGAVTGDNKANAANWPSTAETISYGDLISDIWGLTSPVGSDVKTNFGVALSVNGASTAEAQVDAIRVTIVYTASAGNISIAVSTATLAFSPQAVTVDVPITITINPATLNFAPQAVTIDLGGAGVSITVNPAQLTFSTVAVTIQAPGPATLIGQAQPQTVTTSSLNYIDIPLGLISHAIDASSNPGANSNILKSDDSGYLQLVRLGIGKAPQHPLDVVGNIQLTGELLHTADLTIEATGGDVLLRSTDLSADNWVSGTTGWGINYNGNADFRDITADSLTVEAFIADINLALAGSQLVTKSLGIVSRPFTVPGTTGTLYVYDLPGFENAQVFDDGDYVRLRYIDRSGSGLVVGDAWGTVTLYADLSNGEQSWTWTYVSGLIGQIIGEGGVALDYGASGDGYWHVTTLDTAGSPYAEIGTWVTDPSVAGNHTIHVRMGQLDGIAGIGDEWGLWAGQNTANTYLLLSDTNFAAHNMRLSLYESGGTETIRLDPNTPYLAVGSALPTSPDAGGNGLWVGLEGGSYKFRLGDPAGVALRWDGSSLSLRNNANQDVIILDAAGESYFARPMTLGTDGGIWQGTGTFAAPTTGIKLWNDGGFGRIAGYNAGVLQWYGGTDGKLYAGAGDVVIDAGGISIDTVALTPADRNKVKFLDGSAITVGEIYGLDAGNVSIKAIDPANSNNFSSLAVHATGINIYPNGPVDIIASDVDINITGHLRYNAVLQKEVGIVYDVWPMHYLTTPLTSTSWDGDSKTSADDGIIDLSAVFSVPAGVTAVLVRLSARSSSVNDQAILGPSSTNPGTLVARTQVANTYSDTMGIVPCDSNGDIYFTAVGTVLTIIEIWGYAL